MDNINYKILVRDNDCHWYLIDEIDLDDFNKWVQYSEEMKFDGLKELKDFNKNSINSYKSIKIISYKLKQ